MKKLSELNTVLFEKGITRDRLSRDTGINRSYLSLAINGRWLLTDEEKIKIASALERPVTEIFPA